MELSEIVQVFDNFLQENNSYQQFYQNLESWRGPTSSKHFFITNRHSLGFDFICDAFPWQDLPEGRKFWGDLNSKWNTYLKNYQKNEKRS